MGEPSDEMERAYDDAAWVNPVEIGGLEMANVREGLAAVLAIVEPEQAPTQDAYDATVRALEKHRERADRAEAELRRLAASIPADGRVRVYAVANLHKGRIHGITCNVNQSAAWVRALCDQYGPDAAVQCVDVVDPAQQAIAWDRGERATVTGSDPGGAS